MKTLPIVLSLPHAGTKIPKELVSRLQIGECELQFGKDTYSGEISALESAVHHFITTDISRELVDVNRAPDDFSRDGVIKSHTVENKQTYKDGLYPDEVLIEALLRAYYSPYHSELTGISRDKAIVFGLDCHSMFPVAPPNARIQGVRPAICLSNAENTTCSNEDINHLAELFRIVFDLPLEEVMINYPFNGGYITRTHSKNLVPWAQIEFNRNLSKLGTTDMPKLKRQFKQVLEQFVDYKTK